MNKLPHKKKSGFTLIELAIALTIVVLIAIVAGPNFTSKLPVYRLQNTASEMSSYLRLLRNEAVTRNETLKFEYVESSHELNLYRDDGDTLIRTFDLNVDDNASISMESTDGYFNGHGQFLTSLSSGNLSTLTVTLMDSRISDKRQIRVSQNGRITIHKS